MSKQPPSYPAYRAALNNKATAELRLISAANRLAETEITESPLPGMGEMLKATYDFAHYLKIVKAARETLDAEIAAGIYAEDAPIAEDDETTVPAGIKITQINTPGGMLERGIAAAIPINGTEVQP